MTKNLSPKESSTIRRRELGGELQALRKTAKLTLDQAAKRIAVSASKLCRIEGGQRTATIDEIGGLLAVYTTDAAKRSELLALAHNCGERGWWQRNRSALSERQRTLITLESRAERIVDFEIAVMPGLLQTGEYTHALMTESGLIAEEEIEKNMITRLRRHSVLLRRQPPKLLVIIHELALHQVVGGPDVMRRQLEELLKWSDQANINIHVLPNTGAHAGASGSFILLHLHDRPTVVFLENLVSSLFVEDSNDVEVYRQAVQNLTSRALDEQRSCEMIAMLAKRFGTGAGAHGADRVKCFELA